MAKLLDEIKKKMSNDKFKDDASKVLKIYNGLKNLDDGHIWSSKWRVLVSTTWRKIGDKCEKVYSPTTVGEIFIKGLSYEKD